LISSKSKQFDLNSQRHEMQHAWTSIKTRLFQLRQSVLIRASIFWLKPNKSFAKISVSVLQKFFCFEDWETFRKSFERPKTRGQFYKHFISVFSWVYTHICWIFIKTNSINYFHESWLMTHKNQFYTSHKTSNNFQ
jgi:hypothetical protein